MSSFSLFTTTKTGDNTFTDSSCTIMSDTNIANDDWKNLALRLFSFDVNSTGIVDAFCDAWISGLSSSVLVAPPASSTAIWDHAVTKTVGWTIIMLLKTIFFEDKLDSWSGSYRFLNLGTTLVPFGIAAWTIYDAAMDKVEGTGESNENESPSSMTAALLMMSLWNFIVTTPVVRNWILTGLASVLLHHVLLRKFRPSRTFAVVASIPGILAALLSAAFWITDDATVARILLGTDHPNMLLLQARLLRWTANAVSGWCCYAWIVKRFFRTNRFTSFPCFVIVVAATKIFTTWGTVF